MCQRIISQRYRNFSCFQTPKRNQIFFSPIKKIKRRRDYTFPNFHFYLGTGFYFGMRRWWLQGVKRKSGSYFAGKMKAAWRGHIFCICTILICEKCFNLRESSRLSLFCLWYYLFLLYVWRPFNVHRIFDVVYVSTRMGASETEGKHQETRNLT